MTNYIEKLLHWLYPEGNWGLENGTLEQRKAWGQTYVHLFLGSFCVFPCFVLVRYFGRWGLLGLLIPLLMPIIREIKDGHPLKDFFGNGSEEAKDCRSDILGCWMGSLCSLPFILIYMF